MPFSDAEPDDAVDEAPLTPDLLSRRADVFRALAELDEGERALVVLRYRHGLSYDELANVFGLKAGTARMRVSRALSRMRAALEVEATDLLEAGPPAMRRSAARPEPEAATAAAGFGAGRDAEVEEEAQEQALDELAAAPRQMPAPSAPRQSRSRAAAPKARGGILSRFLGRKKKAPPEDFDDVTPVSAPPEGFEDVDEVTPVAPQRPAAAKPGGAGQPPPPASPAAAPPAAAPPPLAAFSERGPAPAAPTPHPLAAFLRHLDPSAPQGFTKRLLDLANRL